MLWSNLANVRCVLQNGGVLTATYDMGKSVQTLNEPRYNADDGRYHVARFRRSGANATLQLDDKTPRAIRPQGTCRHEHLAGHLWMPVSEI